MVVDTLHSIQVVVKADVWYIAAKLVSVSHHDSEPQCGVVAPWRVQ